MPLNKKTKTGWKPVRVKREWIWTLVIVFRLRASFAAKSKPYLRTSPPAETERAKSLENCPIDHEYRCISWIAV